MNDFGWSMRSDILHRDAEQHIIGPLRRHGWIAEVERIERIGEYALVVATRNGLTRRAALLYSSSTDNAVYKRLESEVDDTFFNGRAFNLEQHTHGLARPVFCVSDFQIRLVEWNQSSIPDKIAPGCHEDEIELGKTSAPRERRLISENPIDAIRSRLTRLHSTTLARNSIIERAEAEGVELNAASATLKGDGVSYAIRNATDYFALKDVGNVSQRVLNLYYGCVSFVFAEMLAAPSGPVELSHIEDVTKQGHGLWTFPGSGDSFGNLVVGPITSGLFSAWAKSFSHEPLLTMNKKPRQETDILVAPPGSCATMQQLFARIPEVGDLFEDIFKSPPAWVTPVYDQASNMSLGIFNSGAKPKTSYVLLIDDSGRITADQIATFSGPIREITRLQSKGRAAQFRVAVDHPNFDVWWKALNLHHSPFERDALIVPLFGCIEEYRAICVTILYALSILVRYRVSLWRRIQEGDLDHLRALIEAFLNVVERMMPEQFLQSITRERISIHQPGSFFA